VLNRARYEWEQHAGVYLKEGGSEAKLRALGPSAGLAEEEESQQSVFNPLERLVLRLTRSLTVDVEVLFTCCL
jgi:hypothetical protein